MTFRRPGKAPEELKTTQAEKHQNGLDVISDYGYHNHDIEGIIMGFEKELRKNVNSYVRRNSIKKLSDLSGVGYSALHGFVKNDRSLHLAAVDKLCRVLNLVLIRRHT